jgi:hypothetical protein
MSDEAWAGLVCAAIKRGDVSGAARLMALWKSRKEAK